MVGLFNLGNKNSPSRPASTSPEPLAAGSNDSIQLLPPPPPYKEATTPPLVMTEVTTTTEVITTTRTTTHFFSLPLWRKRGVPASSHGPMYMNADESGSMSRPGTSYSIPSVDKALPPTPPTDEPLPFPARPSTEHSLVEGISMPDEEGRPSYNSGSTHRPVLEPRRSTAALAHAALGIGLPAILPRVSTSSKSDVHHVALPPIPDHQPRASVRRAKSSHKVRSTRKQPDLPYASDGETSPAARNSSFTSSSIFPSTTDVKGKGKARATQEEVPVAQTPKTISRRPSFWSRKKSVVKEPTRPETSIPITPPSSSTLPVLPPLSPFIIGGSRLTSSPEPQDAVFSARPKSPTRRRSISLTPPPFEGPRRARSPTVDRSSRPMTADPTTSPTRASFFIPPAPLVASPLPSPSLESEGSSVQLEGPAQRRPRAQTNPPILHRLSLNLFAMSSSASSPIQPHSSPLSSNRPSPRPSLAKRPVDIPKPHQDDESPEAYLLRLRAAVSKAELASILATSIEPFHVAALRSYLEEFNFIGDPLDVALRKLLMDVSLPRETQQIDRVIEAFASRYMQCNPDLYTSKDHPYILAFSLIMLHTDAFNKSNKRKMTKADYIKNTRLPGVPSEVLDCFYDNIVFAPFIFIEDPVDVNGQRGLVPNGSNNRLSSASSLVTTTPGISTPTSKSNKVDPYYLILNNLLGPLRINAEPYVPATSPYSCEGTAGPWDSEDLRRDFAQASVLEVGAADPLRPHPFFGLSVGNAPGPLLGNMSAFSDAFTPPSDEVWTLKVAKVALLNRKDDLLPGGKKAMSRKWRPWSVILTGSQLLFFRDTSWATNLVAQFETSGGQVIFPHAAIFKPDELYSVKDAIAVYDRSYTKHPHALRIAMPDARQILLQADSEQERNSWLSHINYASTFKSAGIRMRPLGMSTHDVQLAGVAAATSHLHDLQHQSTTPSSDMPFLPNSENNAVSSSRRPSRSTTLMSERSDLDVDVPRAPEVEGADQLKATFDQVKAELASKSLEELDVPQSPNEQAHINTVHSPPTDNKRMLSRSQIIQAKIRDLDAKISAVQSQLDADLRLVRNVAILAPFQKATRDRLALALRNVMTRVMNARLEVARFDCHRNVLANDLEADLMDWQRTKTVAMRAAADTLRSKKVPRMTLSLYDDAPPASSPIPVERHVSSSSTCKPESSVSESFHSAMDFGVDWPSFDSSTSTSFLGTSRLFDSPSRSSSGSLQLLPFPESESTNKSLPDPPSPAISDRSSPNISSPRSSTDTHAHERFYTAHESLEEAEDWDKTKCAQRVSLVRLPSDIRLSMLFDKHHRSARPSS